mgnify:FL=1|jgi:hypothetical protein|tara:strand:- start:888 stop:1088 length:201 start_codon:yes stop_codon:yes gene_type:complete
MENSDVLTIISNLQDSDARNYFETNERLFLLNISEKIKNNFSMKISDYENDKFNKIYKKYKKFIQV